MGRTRVKQAELPNPSFKHDAFLSKNKKRKEKRYSHELMAKKAETSEFIPVKRSSLRPSQVTGLRGKKATTQLSTSLPIKGIAKKKLENANHSFALCSQNDNPPKKVTGILSNPNTPKRSKSGKEHVTFELSDGIEKSTKKRVARSHQLDEEKRPRVESSDESDADNVDPVDFFDMEADEGEETSSDSSCYSDTSDGKNVDDENTFVSSFLHDEESESGDDDDEDDDDDDEDEDSDTEEEESNSEINPSVGASTKNLKRRELKPEVTTPVRSKKESAPSAISTEATLTSVVKKEELTEQKNPVKTKLRSQAKVVKSIDSKTELKNEQKNVMKERSQGEKSRVCEEELEKKTKMKEKKLKLEGTEEVVTREKFEKPSEFIGFIRKLPATVTQKEIKLALAQIVAANDVLAVMLVKPRRTSGHNAFIYLKDSKSLGNLVHQKVDIGDSSYVVYRAKSSAREESPPEPVGFLPRVPQWITEAELKEVVEKYVGSGKVKEIREKKVLKNLQTRNILISFIDSDALKKAIYQAEFKIKDHAVIIREAAEGVPVPVYRAVFANIPDKTNEATLKKAVEASIGKNTVANVRFSFHKNAFAFVVFKDEASMKKALALGDSLSVNGKKLQVRPYVPRKPHKRAPPNEHAKAKIAKKRKGESASVEPEQSKKLKIEFTPDVPSMLSSPSPNGSQSKNKNKNSSKRKKSAIASPTGQVKATKNRNANKQNKNKKSSFVRSPDKKDKITPPKDQVRVKKSKLKGQKLSKKKND